MAVTVRGVDASLRWGYQSAAILRAWTVTKDDHGVWSLAASVVSTDAYRVAQRPLVFVAPHATGAWRWPIETLQIAGASLSATLGPKEK